MKHIGHTNILIIPKFIGFDAIPMATIRMLEALLLQEYGGYTRTEGTGAYLHEDGDTVSKEAVWIYTVSFPEEKQQALLSLAETLKQDLKQEAIFVSINGKSYLV